MENKLSTVLTRIDLKDLLNHYTDKALERFLLDACPEVKKKIKALEIIKEKEVDLGSLLFYIRSSNHPLAFYNKGIVNEKKKLTKDEFDLLKEVMKCQ